MSLCCSEGKQVFTLLWCLQQYTPTLFILCGRHHSNTKWLTIPAAKALLLTAVMWEGKAVGRWRGVFSPWYRKETGEQRKWFAKRPLQFICTWGQAKKIFRNNNLKHINKATYCLFLLYRELLWNWTAILTPGHTAWALAKATSQHRNKTALSFPSVSPEVQGGTPMSWMSSIMLTIK